MQLALIYLTVYLLIRKYFWLRNTICHIVQNKYEWLFFVYCQVLKFFHRIVSRMSNYKIIVNSFCHEFERLVL